MPVLQLSKVCHCISNYCSKGGRIWLSACHNAVLEGLLSFIRAGRIKILEIYTFNQIRSKCNHFSSVTQYDLGEEKPSAVTEVWCTPIYWQKHQVSSQPTSDHTKNEIKCYLRINKFKSYISWPVPSWLTDTKHLQKIVSNWEYDTKNQIQTVTATLYIH